MDPASPKAPVIIVTEPEYFTDQSIRLMRKVGTVIAKRMTRAQLLKAVSAADVLVVRIDTRVDKDLLRHAPRLKCVVSATTGTNHINTRALKKRGIPLFHLHGTHSIPTAEHALTLMLSAARNVPAAHRSMMEGKWQRWRFIGTGIAGKTLGIFGIGKIGTELASRARGLGMKIIAYDPYVSARIAKQRGARKVAWETFLTQSDFISLHAPLTAKTEGLFGVKEFQMMRPGVIFVNAARGGIVREKALIAAMDNSRVHAAAIDVYPEEPLPVSSILRRYAKRHGNLILTPHIAASTEEAVGDASMYCARALRDFFDKKSPL
jgi:D-3-phosphoglycerate dehydrogenase